MNRFRVLYAKCVCVSSFGDFGEMTEESRRTSFGCLEFKKKKKIVVFDRVCRVYVCVFVCRMWQLISPSHRRGESGRMRQHDRKVIEFAWIPEAFARHGISAHGNAHVCYLHVICKEWKSLGSMILKKISSQSTLYHYSNYKLYLWYVLLSSTTLATWNFDSWLSFVH